MRTIVSPRARLLDGPRVLVKAISNNMSAASLSTRTRKLRAEELRPSALSFTKRLNRG